MTYAGSQYLPSIQEYVPAVQRARAQGRRAYKPHPGSGQHEAARDTDLRGVTRK